MPRSHSTSARLFICLWNEVTSLTHQCLSFVLLSPYCLYAALKALFGVLETQRRGKKNDQTFVYLELTL